MYLIFQNKQEAEERSLIEAMRQGCDLVKTRYYWSIEESESGVFYCDVGNGETLSEDELAKCVNEIETE